MLGWRRSRALSKHRRCGRSDVFFLRWGQIWRQTSGLYPQMLDGPFSASSKLLVATKYSCSAVIAFKTYKIQKYCTAPSSEFSEMSYFKPPPPSKWSSFVSQSVLFRIIFVIVPSNLWVELLQNFHIILISGDMQRFVKKFVKFRGKSNAF